MIKLVNITTKAINKLKYLKDFKDKFLYINITGGGCSGFQYHFNLVDAGSTDTNNPQNNQTNNEESKIVIYDDNLVKIFSNPESTELMRGSTLDFQQELIGSKFVLDDIQNSTRKCSCGNSFELKD